MRNSLASLTLGTILTATTSLLAQQGPAPAISEPAANVDTIRDGVAQERLAIPEPAVNEAEELMRRVAALEREVAGLKAKTSQHDEDLKVLANRVLSHDESIKTHGTSIESNTSAITRLAQGQSAHEERFDTNEQRLLANERNIRDNNQKLNDIAKFDNSTGTGKYRLDLLGNMQSREFQKEFEQSSKRRVLILNNTASEQRLYINGTPWRVLRGLSYAPVAAHTLTLQRNAFDPRVVSDAWRPDRNGGFEIVYDWAGNFAYSETTDFRTPSAAVPTLTSSRSRF